MPDISVPDTALLKKSLWSAFSIKDAIYALFLVFMLMNQHFNNEERLQKLESANIQIAETLTKLSNRMDTDMVPRKEIDSSNNALDIRLGNIEKGQENIMTYLLGKR